MRPQGDKGFLVSNFRTLVNSHALRFACPKVEKEWPLKVYDRSEARGRAYDVISGYIYLPVYVLTQFVFSFHTHTYIYRHMDLNLLTRASQLC